MIRLWQVLDLLYLLALMIYATLGVPDVPFHGDESMQIYASSDYFTAFVDGAPERLLTQPPYDIDTDPHLRILNGSVNRYLIGWFWQFAGYTRDDLPPRPGWDWGLSYDDNVATAHRPSEDQLLTARLPSALLLALSIPILFGLGQTLGGRGAAYLAAALYTLNPVVLINGGRAMQEGALLCFGLLTILAAARLTAAPRSLAARWLLWALLALASGLTLASKHSGAVFVLGAFTWLLSAALIGVVRALIRRQGVRAALRDLGARMIALAAAAALGLGLFVALSPALWNDPPARLQNLLAERSRLLDIQVSAAPDSALTLAQRAEAILVQPFIAAPQYYEAPPFDVPAIHEEIGLYRAAWFSGMPAGPLLGGAITLLAGVGLIALLVRAWRGSGTAQAAAVGLLAWALVSAAALMTNPLPWQRYYLPLIPLLALLAALALAAAARLAARRM